MIKLCELFSGIGAQRMGLINAGIPFESVGISEISNNAIAAYNAIYGDDGNNLGDITKVDALPYCDLLTVSFPCQDLSMARNRKGQINPGLSGGKSGLVWTVLDVLMREREA